MIKGIKLLLSLALIVSLNSNASAQGKEITKILKTTSPVISVEQGAEFSDLTTYLFNVNKEGDVEINQKQSTYTIQDYARVYKGEKISTLKVNPAKASLQIIEGPNEISIFVAGPVSRLSGGETEKIKNGVLVTFPITDKEKVMQVYNLFNELVKTSRKNYKPKPGEDMADC